MKRLVVITCTVVILAGTSALSTSRIVRAAERHSAVVTYLDGTAEAYTTGSAKGVRLRRNDRVARNQEVRVGDRSRIELRFPDGTIMRFAEHSVIKMENIAYNTKTRKKNVRVAMGFGKLWASVKKLFSADSKVEVKTENAVAGVRGTVYRVNVNEDNSAMVKVYDGSVYVDGAQKRPSSAASETVGPPVEIPGPHEVPPPYHEVTMEEWHVIVKSFQQITISPQGAASEPSSFDRQQDLDDWVKWNQERDKKLGK